MVDTGATSRGPDTCPGRQTRSDHVARQSPRMLNSAMQLQKHLCLPACSGMRLLGNRQRNRRALRRHGSSPCQCATS